MNLELNLEENSYLKFSKPPYENNKLYNMYSPIAAMPQSRDLYSIEDFVGNVDFEEFTKYTTMEHVIVFNRALETFHNHYSHWLPEYTFEVTPSYLWKRGVYDALKEWHLANCGFNKKNAGVEYFFNRIDSNTWMFNRLKEQLVTLDDKRKKARLAVGKVVDNLDDLVSKFKDTIDEINDSTEKANKFSKLFQVYNHVAYPSNNIALEESDYTGVQLFTVVVAKPKNMMVIRGDNEKLFDMKVPKAYLIFQRPLFRALSGNSRSYSINSNACSPGAKHPYIDCNREPFYDRDVRHSS
jgi:CRISPR/Cas system CSM-associated protein Csm2 small subunit